MKSHAKKKHVFIWKVLNSYLNKFYKLSKLPFFFNYIGKYGRKFDMHYKYLPYICLYICKYEYIYDWCPIFHNGHFRDIILNNISITATFQTPFSEVPFWKPARIFIVFLSPPVRCWKSTLIRPLLPSSKSHPI